MRLPLVGRSSTGGERVASALGRLGIDLILSLAGSQTLPIADAAVRLPGLRLVCPRSERHGAFMAEGYGRAAGFPAVLMSTLGPGVANEALGLFSARLGRAPVLCISPQQPPRKRLRIAEVFQGLDHRKYFEALSKRIFLVEHPSELESTLDLAFDACRAEPAGPVRVEITFPMLFARSRSRAGRAEHRRLSQPRRLLVLESAGAVDPALGSELEAASSETLWPGVGRPGFALPFALGAALALDRGSVTVVTSITRLLDHLDTLEVARAARQPIELLCVEESEALSDIARRLAVPLLPKSIWSALRGTVAGRLSIVISET